MTYKYTLPTDDQEVIVSAAAMALLDLVKQPLIIGREHVEVRAVYLCEQTHQHSREPLTNDYEAWKALFIPNFVTIYLRSADRMNLDVMRRIADKYDLLTVLAEYRNIVKLQLFPDLADLSRLTMAYEGALMSPHRTTDGYYVAFIYEDRTYRSASWPTPTEALQEAKGMVHRLKNNEGGLS
jgi:hypothetical protein